MKITGTKNSLDFIYIFWNYLALIVFEVCQDGQAMLLHHNLQQSRQLPYRLTTFPTITNISKGHHQPGSRGMGFSSHHALWLLRWRPSQYGNNSSSCFPDLSFQSVWSQEVQLAGWCFNPLTVAWLYIRLIPEKRFQSLMDSVPQN